MSAFRRTAVRLVRHAKLKNAYSVKSNLKVQRRETTTTMTLSSAVQQTHRGSGGSGKAVQGGKSSSRGRRGVGDEGVRRCPEADQESHVEARQSRAEDEGRPELSEEEGSGGQREIGD